MKAAVAPMFSARACASAHGPGANILGGGDGETLADRSGAQSKLTRRAGSSTRSSATRSRRRCGSTASATWASGRPRGTTSASRASSATRMKLQFTWEGCDSALAAPLLLDLARLGALALERGRGGFVEELAFFFKDPAGTDEHRARPAVRDARALGAPGDRGVKPPAPRAVAELVRLPAVLSVPGDVLVGAAASGQLRDVPRAAGLAAASSCLYLGGMALNDYADRDGRRGRTAGAPDPVGPGLARLRARPRRRADRAVGGLAVAADGARAWVLAPLAATVWAYDLALKETPAAVTGMAACRALDVLLGRVAHGARAALPAAAVVGAAHRGHRRCRAPRSGAPARAAARGAGGDRRRGRRRRLRAARAQPLAAGRRSPRPAWSAPMRRPSAAPTPTPRGTRRPSGCSARSAPGSSASCRWRPACSPAPGARPRRRGRGALAARPLRSPAAGR